VRREGRSGLALLAFGALVESARKIAERLDATLVNMRFVKPLDEKLVLSRGAAPRHRHHRGERRHGRRRLRGRRMLAAHGVQLPLLQLGIPDRFIEHGSRDTCLDAAGLAASVDGWWTPQLAVRMRSAQGA
jgi:1-deoxy-D-xylulose-5-phosphate synthase